VDASGTPFMLEINPNCGVYYPAADAGSADLCLAQDPAGHEGFTRQLIAAAFARHKRRTSRARGTPRGKSRVHRSQPDWTAPA
jgi:D-alanine-D-alanine ligase